MCFNLLDKFVFVLRRQIAVLFGDGGAIAGFVHVLFQARLGGGGGAAAFSHGAVDHRFRHHIGGFDRIARFLAQVAHAVGERVQFLLDGFARRFDAIFDFINDVAGGFFGFLAGLAFDAARDTFAADAAQNVVGRARADEGAKGDIFQALPKSRALTMTMRSGEPS